MEAWADCKKKKWRVNICIVIYLYDISKLLMKSDLLVFDV